MSIVFSKQVNSLTCIQQQRRSFGAYFGRTLVEVELVFVGVVVVKQTDCTSRRLKRHIVFLVLLLFAFNQFLNVGDTVQA